MNNIAIIVGDRGQDGTLLRADLELQGIQVVGIGRERMSLPASLAGSWRGEFSIANSDQVMALVETIRPSEIYYLAAHHVSSEQNGADYSPSEYEAYHKVNVLGLLNFLCAIRNHSPESKLFYAASSLVFDGNQGSVQNEETPLTPVGFYGLTKAQGILLCRDFRERYGIFAASGILYNHESVIRPEKFLSKKLITSAHQISIGLKNELVLGNLSAEADWGYAPDFVAAFQHILSTNNPDDYIVATGESRSVAEFARVVFECFGLDYKKYVYENSSLLNRHVPQKIGDSSKLRSVAGWQPTHNFSGMVRALVRDYLESLSANKTAEVSVATKPV